MARSRSQTGTNPHIMQVFFNPTDDSAHSDLLWKKETDKWIKNFKEMLAFCSNEHILKVWKSQDIMVKKYFCGETIHKGKYAFQISLEKRFNHFSLALKCNAHRLAKTIWDQNPSELADFINQANTSTQVMIIHDAILMDNDDNDPFTSTFISDLILSIKKSETLLDVLKKIRLNPIFREQSALLKTQIDILNDETRGAWLLPDDNHTEEESFIIMGNLGNIPKFSPPKNNFPKISLEKTTDHGLQEKNGAPPESEIENLDDHIFKSPLASTLTVHSLFKLPPVFLPTDFDEPAIPVKRQKRGG